MTNLTPKTRFTSLVLAVLVAGVLPGCVYRSISKQATPPVAIKFDDNAISSYPTSTNTDGNLWKNFHDPILDQLIKRSLQENRSLQQVVASVDQARAFRSEAIAALFPEVQVAADRNSQVPSKLNPLIPPTIGKINSFQSGFDSAWELDVFGAANYAARAANADVKAADANFKAARQALIAETAQAYFNLRADQAHFENALARAEAARQLSDIAKQRRGVGRISGLDEAVINTQASAALAGLEPARAAVDNDINRLMVLTVLTTDQVRELVGSHGSIPTIEALTPVGSPTDWLARRPDVHAAEYRLTSAIARANVARGEYFPQVTLTGFYGYNAQKASDLGSQASRQWNFGPSISWQFLDIGRTLSDIRSSNAAARQALEQFDATVLGALQEINNGLEGFKAANQSLTHWRNAFDSSQNQMQLNVQRGNSGLADPVAVLNAQLSFYDTTDQYVSAQLRQASFLAQLYKALAGDFTE